MNTLTKIKDAVRGLIAPCLLRPDCLLVELVASQMTILQVQPAKEDMGRIIGKGGGNIAALKSLVEAIRDPSGRSCRLNVVDGHAARGSAPRQWSLASVLSGVGAYLEVAGHPAQVEIVSGVEDQYVMFLSATPPEEIAIPLSRWISLMGVEGGCRILIDEPATP